MVTWVSRWLAGNHGDAQGIPAQVSVGVHMRPILHNLQQKCTAIKGYVMNVISMQVSIMQVSK